MKHATDHLIKADPVLAAIIEKVGPCSLTPRAPTFETLARSITFQQLSGKAAGTIFERLRNAVGRRFTAAAFLRLTEAELRACGLSRQKIASLTDLAEHVASRRIEDCLVSSIRRGPGMGALPSDPACSCLSGRRQRHYFERFTETRWRIPTARLFDRRERLVRTVILVHQSDRRE